MKLIKLSDDFSPLHEGVIFGINTESNVPSNVVVRIVDVTSNEEVGTQYLRGVTYAEVNIAPYVSRLEWYAPDVASQTSFTNAPVARYKICVDDIDSEEVVLSVNRGERITTPAVVSSFPSLRRIAYGESSTLLILAKPAATVSAEITANNGEQVSVSHSNLSGAVILSISTEDFSSEIQTLDVKLSCSGEEFASLKYVVDSPTKTAKKLAWISESGAIEQYDFPISNGVSYAAEKHSVVTSEGVQTCQCKTVAHLSICSRYEPSAVIESLSQIISSPKVWIKQGDEFKRVEVATSSVARNYLDKPDLIKLDLRLWEREVSL